jgi:simple sugar transport system permease protein
MMARITDALRTVSQSLGSRRRIAEGLLVPLISVLLALATVAIILLIVGANPLTAYASMINAAFGSPYAVSATIIKAMPRLLAALGIAIAIRANLWNIGAEGQIYIGGTAAAGMVLALPALPQPLVPIVAIVAGGLAGAAWGAIPGFLRAHRGINEVITSLMLVYVGIQITQYLLEGPWAVPMSTFPATAPFEAHAKLPVLIPGTVLNAGIFVVLVGVALSWFLVALSWFLVDRTRFGLELRSLGGNEIASGFLGIKVTFMIIATMAVSGAFAGVAGAVETIGIRGRLIEGFSPGFGFEAIAIALLGRLHPAGIVAAALLFGALDAGGAGLQTSARGVSSAIVMVAAGLSVGYVLVGMGYMDKRAKRRAARRALVNAAAAASAQQVSTGVDAR